MVKVYIRGVCNKSCNPMQRGKNIQKKYKDKVKRSISIAGGTSLKHKKIIKFLNTWINKNKTKCHETRRQRTNKHLFIHSTNQPTKLPPWLQNNFILLFHHNTQLKRPRDNHNHCLCQIKFCHPLPAKKATAAATAVISNTLTSIM